MSTKPIEDEQKVEILQVEKLNSVCCFIQRRTCDYKDIVLHNPMLRNSTVKNLTFEENRSQS